MRRSTIVRHSLTIVLLILTATTLLAASDRRLDHVRSTPSPSHVFGRDSTGRLSLQRTQQIYIYVTVDYYFEGPTGLWIYNYTVTNEYSSTASLDIFAITPAYAPRIIGAPAHWTGFRAYQGDTASIAWGVTDDVPHGGDDGLSVYESPYNPAAGAITTGFQVKSQFGPAPIIFYAQGFEPLSSTDDATDLDQFAPLPPTIWQAGVRGDTYGPGYRGTVGTEEQGGRREIEVQPARPNPARDNVQIAFYLPRAEEVVLMIHDVAGREVRTLVRQPLGAGVHSYMWDGKNATGTREAPGVYFYTLHAGGRKVAERRIVIVR